MMLLMYECPSLDWRDILISYSSLTPALSDSTDIHAYVSPNFCHTEFNISVDLFAYNALFHIWLFLKER
jgi:hypothetical protein